MVPCLGQLLYAFVSSPMGVLLPPLPLPLRAPLHALWQAVQRGSCFDGQLSLARHLLLLPLPLPLPLRLPFPLPMAINHVM